MTGPHPDPTPEQLQSLYADMGEALRPVFDDMARWIRQVHTALGGDEGIRRLCGELEQAQKFREQWEAEHPHLRWGDSCHCVCRRWHDADLCDGWAETTRTAQLFGAPLHIPLCLPCAAVHDESGMYRR